MSSEVSQGNRVRTDTSLKSKLSHYFGAHGRFCASHPWEVIVSIVTLTVCALSMSVLRGGGVGTVCGYSKPCQPKPMDEEVADTLLLSIVNCLAVIYIYRQFSRLRKAGSKYLLGIAGLFAIFSSFVFGTTVVSVIDSQVSGLNEALPFFLLLIDLSKASALAKMAFKSKSKEEVRVKIGEGIAALGPTMTLDTLVEILLISIGTISGVPKFETVCCFGCISIAASYLVFMTFFPASLALVLEVCPYDPGNSGWHLDNLARDMQEEEMTKKPNPVAQRVKIIMALGLVVVHMHSWFSGLTGLHLLFSPSVEKKEQVSGLMGQDLEMVPLHSYLYWKLFNLSIDQLIAIILAVILFTKYIFLDKYETFSTSVPATPTLQSKGAISKKTAGVIVSKQNCPFAFPVVSPQSSSGQPAGNCLTRRQISSSVSSPLPTGNIQSVDSVAKSSSLIENGVVIDHEALARSSTLALPTTSEKQELSMTNGSISDSSGQALLHGLETASIGIQADLAPTKSLNTIPESERPVFSLGSQDRRMSVASSTASNSGGSDDEQVKSVSPSSPSPARDLETCLEIFKSERGAELLTDEEVIALVHAKHIPAYNLENALSDPQRGVAIRRQLLLHQLSTDSTRGNSGCLNDLPYSSYPHYSLVNGACCENVIGYIPVPVGHAGPLLLDGASYMVPMATTEGALVASTNRGCRALAVAGGVKSSILGDGMTRGPVVRLPSATEASQVKVWLDDRDNFELIEEAFNETSRFARLKNLHTAIAGRLLYIRFKASTGDAMGMNMISKGVDRALGLLKEQFPLMEVISISGNFCTDKKAAAINWLEGRGKSVVCEATIPAQTVAKVLKTSVPALVELNVCKNLIGSAMAGSIGGFNAHASNIVTAIFIATGQDPAQNVASSNCMTLMEQTGPTGEDLHITCTMPSIEIGTVGGGTVLPPQGACLDMLGLRGANIASPGANATQLARIVCGTVLAGELSLLSALAAGHLVKSHLKHNRSHLNLSSIVEAPETKTDRRVSLPATLTPAPAVSGPRRTSSPISSDNSSLHS